MHLFLASFGSGCNVSHPSRALLVIQSLSVNGSISTDAFQSCVGTVAGYITANKHTGLPPVLLDGNQLVLLCSETRTAPLGQGNSSLNSVMLKGRCIRNKKSNPLPNYNHEMGKFPGWHPSCYRALVRDLHLSDRRLSVVRRFYGETARPAPERPKHYSPRQRP